MINAICVTHIANVSNLNTRWYPRMGGPGLAASAAYPKGYGRRMCRLHELLMDTVQHFTCHVARNTSCSHMCLSCLFVARMSGACSCRPS